MCKRLLCVGLLLLLLVGGNTASAQSVDLLILYETAGTGIVEKQLQAVSDILLYMTRTTRYLRLEDATQKDLDDCANVILLVDETYVLKQELADSLRKLKKPVFVIGPGGIMQLADEVIEITETVQLQYSFSANDVFTQLIRAQPLRLMTKAQVRGGGILKTSAGTFPLRTSFGHISHFALFDASNRGLISAFATELTSWLWPYDDAPHAFAGYVVLDDVSPVTDIERLYAAAEILEGEAIPYAIAVMPVYDNGNYPAMQRFCEALRYLQSRGVSIIMRTPLVRLEEVEADALKERIALACAIYTQYGVYPLALKAPESYIHSLDGIDVLRGFRTIFLFETDDVPQWDIKCIDAIYRDGHQIIAPDSNGLRSTAYSTAVYINIEEPLENIRERAESLRQAHVPLRSLRAMSHSCYFGDAMVTFQPWSGLFLNGTRDALAFRPFVYEEDFDFERDIIHYLTNQIAASSQVLLLAVLICSVAFILCILLARKLMRRQFILRKLRKNNAEDVGWV